MPTSRSATNKFQKRLYKVIDFLFNIFHSGDHPANASYSFRPLNPEILENSNVAMKPTTLEAHDLGVNVVWK